MKKYFWIITFIIILFGFITRIYIIHDNNLYFTVDQGRDAVYVREVLNSHTIITRGPESSVRGLFTGPLWYYFISIGYAVMNGNPAGSILVLITLNLAVTLAVIYIVKKEINEKAALTIGFGLIVFWPFFTTSLYGFNPFPLVALSIILIMLLVKKKYGWALVPILLAFNTELAGAVAFLIFYILVLSIFLFMRKIVLKKYLIYAWGIPSIGLLKIISDFVKTPKNTTAAGLNVFSGTNFIQMTNEFIKMIGSIIPQNTTIGFLLIIAIAIMYMKRKRKNKFTKPFVELSFVLVFVSYLFFGSNHGWREWHTVYISTLTLLTTLLMCYEMHKIGKLLMAAILILNIFNFKNNYVNYLKPSDDRSLLYNQMKVIDWIYTHNENNGFNLYTYTDSFYDYSYQYLVSWYGKGKYGFYPCEYANFPLSIKDLYVPGNKNYTTPQLGCDKFRFLIIDSETNGNDNKDWIDGFRKENIVLETTQIGGIKIEKLQVPDRIN